MADFPNNQVCSQVQLLHLDNLNYLQNVFQWLRSFCIQEFPVQNLLLSPLSFLYELHTSVMSLYFFQVTDKVLYSITTVCFPCLETKFSTDESQLI